MKVNANEVTKKIVEAAYKVNAFRSYQSSRQYYVINPDNGNTVITLIDGKVDRDPKAETFEKKRYQVAFSGEIGTRTADALKELYYFLEKIADEILRDEIAEEFISFPKNYILYGIQEYADCSIEVTKELLDELDTNLMVDGNTEIDEIGAAMGTEMHEGDFLIHTNHTMGDDWVTWTGNNKLYYVSREDFLSSHSSERKIITNYHNFG